jgi:O-antigen ligase
MAHRRALIVALAAGFMVGNLSQAWQVVAVPMGWPTWVRMPDRISGWWPPAMGGSMLCAALGLHLPAAVMGSGRMRVVGVVGATVTAAGLLATGTRGAWVAGAALTAVALGFGAWRWMVGRDRVGVARFAGVAAVLTVAAAVGWLVLREPITRRVVLAREDIAAALERHDYRSDTGARILMATAALRAIRERPVGGVGAGGYQAWAQSRLRAEGEPEAAALIHAHAHNAPLHIGATTGLVGLAIWGFIVVVALRGGAVGSGTTARASGGPLTRGTPEWGGWGSYDAAPFFAIVGLGLVGLFDVVQLNTQTVALLGTLLAMCMVSRPPAARMPFGKGGNAGEVAGPERR